MQKISGHAREAFQILKLTQIAVLYGKVENFGT
jgi:hypothetical protein